ncbi:MAG: 23S rRNA (uracil(1939)-C(5))-methyltransferase RlmD, partial [Pseudomonadota bacterium]
VAPGVLPPVTLAHPCASVAPGVLPPVTLAHPCASEQAALSYRLPNYGVELFFLPTDFTQVNADINRQMVDRVVAMFELQSHEHVLDLFCGLGNFTLPLARHAAHVTGVEGDAGLVRRARENAAHNAITNVEFHAANLNEDCTAEEWAKRGFDKILLDPPRTGAPEIVKRLAAFGAGRVVYVSCNPATLARDAAELVNGQGYKLASAGVMDMFPHTTHVESIALFEKN